MAESSNQGRRHQAVQAMTNLGFDWIDVHAALEDLLLFYEYNWDYIEANNYYHLVDWILNCRPILPRREGEDEPANGEEEFSIPVPPITELGRFQDLNPLLMPLKTAVPKSGLAEVESQKDRGNPPSPACGAESAKIYPMDLDTASSLARFQAMNPMLMPLEKSMGELGSGKSTSEGSGDPQLSPQDQLQPKNGKILPLDPDNLTVSPKRVKFLDNIELCVEIPILPEDPQHMQSMATPPPSPTHSGSVAGKIYPDTGSPDSALKQTDCTTPPNEQISIPETSACSKADIEKGKMVLSSGDTDLRSGDQTPETFKFLLDPELSKTLKLKGKVHYSGPASRGRRNYLLNTVSDSSVHELKVSSEYLNNILQLVGTEMWLGQETLKESVTSEVQGNMLFEEEITSKPLDLDPIQHLVKEMSHAYFRYMSLPSSLSSSPCSGSTSTLDLGFEDAESPPGSPRPATRKP